VEVDINISIIIPVYREEGHINAAITALLALKKTGAEYLEIIVVDGDQSGSTIGAIKSKEVITMTAAKGRALQMNTGAKIARGEILLFLHADTFLPENGLAKIKEAIVSKKYVAGAFNLSTKGMNLFMKHIYYTSVLRSRVTRIAYGDQAIFIDKDYFEQLGGYPEIPIMEDIELMAKIKKNKDKICILKEKASTSPRRYEEEGQIFNWLRNHKIRLLYFLGVKPEQLVKLYPDTRKKNEI